MVFRYGVAAEWGTGTCRRRPSASSESSSCSARSVPSNSSTESSASSHSCVSRGSGSTSMSPLPVSGGPVCAGLEDYPRTSPRNRQSRQRMGAVTNPGRGRRPGPGRGRRRGARWPRSARRAVVGVAGQVVEVAEQAEVGHAGRGGDPVDHGDGVGGGAQGVAGGAADRLDQHRAPDPGRGPAGQGQVLGGQLVLGGGVRVLDPVAVEGVEGPAAQPLADAEGDGEVVAELGRAGRPGDQPAVAPARSPAAKFRPTSRTPASATARTNASTSASAGTASGNGHRRGWSATMILVLWRTRPGGRMAPRTGLL